MGFIAAHGAEAYAAAQPRLRDQRLKARLLQRAVRQPDDLRDPVRDQSMRELCEEVAGGLKDGRAIKAIQLGGPLGGILPASKLDTAFDFDALAAEGCMVGHGSILAFDDQTNMRDGRHPPAALRRARELRQVLSVPDRAQAGIRRVRLRSTGRQAALRAAAGGARARIAVRPRRRHPSADALAADPLRRRAGAELMSLTVTVDGTPVEVANGTTILEACQLVDSWVPTLCYDERQAPFGACRVCLVAVRAPPSRCRHARRRAATEWRSTPTTRPAGGSRPRSSSW